MIIPHFMNENTVDAHGEDFDIQLLKFGIFFGNCRNFSGSDEGEITGIKAEQHPFS